MSIIRKSGEYIVRFDKGIRGEIGGFKTLVEALNIEVDSNLRIYTNSLKDMLQLHNTLYNQRCIRACEKTY